jgi:hypothetical protein
MIAQAQRGIALAREAIELGTKLAFDKENNDGR